MMRETLPSLPRARRPSFRFTLRGLMVSCFYAAFGLAALLRPSPMAANFLAGVTVCLLLAAIVAAIVARGRVRAFAVGFAAFGWAYLLLTSWPGSGASPTLMATSRLIYRLLPARLSLQDYPAYYASCTAIENVVYAALGGGLSLSLSTAWGARARAGGPR